MRAPRLEEDAGERAITRRQTRLHGAEPAQDRALVERPRHLVRQVRALGIGAGPGLSVQIRGPGTSRRSRHRSRESPGQGHHLSERSVLPPPWSVRGCWREREERRRASSNPEVDLQTGHRPRRRVRSCPRSRFVGQGVVASPDRVGGVAVAGGGHGAGQAVGDLAPGVAVVAGVGDQFVEPTLGLGNQAEQG